MTEPEIKTERDDNGTYYAWVPTVKGIYALADTPQEAEHAVRALLQQAQDREAWLAIDKYEEATMTVADLHEALTALIARGEGERTVEMGDPVTNAYVECTGLWVPDDEAVVQLECIEWAPDGRSVLVS